MQRKKQKRKTIDRPDGPIVLWIYIFTWTKYRFVFLIRIVMCLCASNLSYFVSRVWGLKIKSSENQFAQTNLFLMLVFNFQQYYFCDDRVSIDLNKWQVAKWYRFVYEWMGDATTLPSILITILLHVTGLDLAAFTDFDLVAFTFHRSQPPKIAIVIQ